ncbi:MAG: PIN domain-containing protein [Vicinamibacteria bacterium]
MSDRAFVDTNVLVYAHDRSAGVKHEKARALVEALWRDRAGVVSTQVLQELCVAMRKMSAGPPSPPDLARLVADYLRWDVVVNTGESIVEALEIEERFGLSFWDALIVQAAAASGAATLYSEDLSDGQSYGTVRVVNPLAG